MSDARGQHEETRLGKVERPFSYIRQDFFLGRSFRNLDDLNGQLADSSRSPLVMRYRPLVVAASGSPRVDW